MSFAPLGVTQTNNLLCTCLDIMELKGLLDYNYVNGTRCRICLTEFWQRKVLLNHIRRGRSPCKRQVVLRGPVLTTDHAFELKLELRIFFTKTSTDVVSEGTLLRFLARAHMVLGCLASRGQCANAKEIRRYPCGATLSLACVSHVCTLYFLLPGVKLCVALVLLRCCGPQADTTLSV